MRTNGAAFRGTGTRVIVGSTSGSHSASRPIVPATYVPEELVSQAQVVLQGKSRSLIVRELQVISLIFIRNEIRWLIFIHRNVTFNYFNFVKYAVKVNDLTVL